MLVVGKKTESVSCAPNGQGRSADIIEIDEKIVGDERKSIRSV